jgi:hypothetical protein
VVPTAALPAALGKPPSERGAQQGKAKKESCPPDLKKPPPPQSQRKKQPPPCGSSGGQARADFNGDGVSDLAVGVPRESIGTIPSAGAVHVLYGSATGLTATGNQLIHQDTEGIADTAESVDNFGSALAAGDFDLDGFSDLAVGVPREDVALTTDAGAVNVIYGSPTGLAAARNELWTQDSAAILDRVDPDDRFGQALVWGDFGRDGAADLAVGVPFEENAPGATDAGAVNVLYGSATGAVAGRLSAAGNQFLHQDFPGVLDTEETFDRFGQVLAAGDFDRSGKAELAVGIGEEDLSGTTDAGIVQVFYSEGDRLSPADNQLWHQDSPGILGATAGFDSFGVSLAAGDFNGNGTADLAVGSHDVVDGIFGAGAVNVIYGTPDTSVAGGLQAAGNQLWDQGSPGIADTPEDRERWGSALAAGNFGDSERVPTSDLAVGAPLEDVGAALSAGAVNVIYGTSGGLRATGSQFWHQGNVGGDTPETGDGFGEALSAWNFGNGAPADLAVGVPFEDFGSIGEAGAAHVLYGVNPGGLSAAGSQLWHQDSPGILDAIEQGDFFGDALY